MHTSSCGGRPFDCRCFVQLERTWLHQPMGSLLRKLIFRECDLYVYVMPPNRLPEENQLISPG